MIRGTVYEYEDAIAVYARIEGHEAGVREINACYASGTKPVEILDDLAEKHVDGRVSLQWKVMGCAVGAAMLASPVVALAGDAGGDMGTGWLISAIITQLARLFHGL